MHYNTWEVEEIKHYNEVFCGVLPEKNRKIHNHLSKKKHGAYHTCVEYLIIHSDREIQKRSQWIFSILFYLPLVIQDILSNLIKEAIAVVSNQVSCEYAMLNTVTEQRKTYFSGLPVHGLITRHPYMYMNVWYAKWSVQKIHFAIIILEYASWIDINPWRAYFYTFSVFIL